MNPKEILKIFGSTNAPIALGGYNSDSFDIECSIYNVVIFDGENTSDEIITHESKTLKVTHETLSQTNSKTLLSYENLQIIQDEQWDLKMLISKIQEKKEILFSTSAKNSLVESQFALSKAKNALETDDPFVSCWIKCATISLIDSILFQNQITPNPIHSLSSLRNLKQKEINQFSDKIIAETGIERSTKSLLSRMLKSSCGFSDMVENNHNSMVIEKKSNYLIQNSLLSDCYLYLIYQNQNNFYKIKNSLNRNSDKIHILKTAFDLTSSSSELHTSIDSMYHITNELLTLGHKS